MLPLTLLTALCGLLALPSSNALIGITIDMYNPSCAFACRSVIGSAMLECPDADMPDHSTHAMRKRHGHASPVTPACRAVNAPFLSTLAYCISTKCYPDPAPAKSRIEWYFNERATGDPARKLPPMWSYGEALAAVNGTPSATYDPEEMVLNSTMLVDDGPWQDEKQSMEFFWWMETLHSRYSLTVILVGAGIPILLYILQNLPYGRQASHWLAPRYIQPALWGMKGRVIEPILHVFNAPTLGQSFYIGLMVVLVLVLSFVEIKTIWPMTWYPDEPYQAASYIANRTGALSMALMPLTILFAGRNNFLLWCTGWSHSTYLLMHRWIARLCVLEATLHSIIELGMYVSTGDWAMEQKELYWIWGAVATVAGIIILIAAQPRKFYYEIFLITHILLVVFFIAATWYHIDYLFSRYWGYEYWIYACAAVWFVDRVLRLWRTLKNGLEGAVITPIGDEIVRVDVPGVRWSVEPGQHAYIFLPALRKWAPWENHPFSVVPTVLLRTAPSASASVSAIDDNAPLTATSTNDALPPVSSSSSSFNEHALKPAAHDIEPAPLSSSNSTHKDLDLEKHSALPVLASRSSGATPGYTTKGITLFIKRQSGLTSSFLASHGPSPKPKLTAILDGPYKNNRNSSILRVDRLVLIAGGIGITAILPYACSHPNAALHWSVREAQRALVAELDLDSALPRGMYRDVRVGAEGRVDVREALEREVRDGWKCVGVVVCGPGGMCDDVRKEVVRLGRTTITRFELEVEAFTW